MLEGSSLLGPQPSSHSSICLGRGRLQRCLGEISHHVRFSLPFDVSAFWSCFLPLASVDDDSYEIITSPHGDSHHPTPPDNVGQGTGQDRPPPTKPDTNTGDNKLPSSKPPTSPADDPDLSKTVHCTAPYRPDLPLVQYALMIDAGSTGSRIHIYKFNNCGPSAAYEYEVLKNLQPGLSHYKTSPQQTAEGLDELMDEAVKVVPKSLRKRTHVAVKATAGLKLLGETQSKDILDAVANRLREKYEFHLRSNERT